MSVIFFLIAIGILVAGGFLVAFIWSVRSGQYDDDYTPSVRMLFDNHKDNNSSDDLKSSNDTDSSDDFKSSDESEQSNNNKS